MRKRYIPNCRLLASPKVRRKRLEKKARHNFTVVYHDILSRIVFENLVDTDISPWMTEPPTLDTHHIPPPYQTPNTEHPPPGA